MELPSNLRRYVWKTLWIHENWSHPSPPEFCKHRIRYSTSWKQAQLLPGGRWLIGNNGRKVFAIDLKSAISHRLFVASYLGYRTISAFFFSFHSVRSSLRMALVGCTLESGNSNNSCLIEILSCHSAPGKLRACIYQVDYLDRDPPFRSTLLATIWCENYGRLRSGEVSDRHFVLCSGSKDFGTLQFHRLADDPTVSQQFVKRSYPETGLVSASSLCRPCLMVFSTRHGFSPMIV